MALQKDRDRLSELIEKGKKRIKPISSEESAGYNEALEQLLDKTGLSSEVFPYVTGATSICGLDGLMRWLKRQESPTKQLQEFLESKYFKESKADTKAGILFSSLKSVLSEGNIPRECTSILLAAVPSVCRNKKGKWLSSIHKIFHKKFSDSLDLNIELPPVDTLGLDLNTITTIGDMAENIYTKMMGEDGIKPDGIKQRRILEWLGKKYPENVERVIPQMERRDSVTRGKASEVPMSDISPKSDVKIMPSSATAEMEAQSHAAPLQKEFVFPPQGESHDKSILSLMERISAMLPEIGKHVQGLAERDRRINGENSRLRGDLINRSHTLEAALEANETLRRDIAEKVREINGLKSEIQRLEAEYAHFRKESEEQFSRKEEDIERSGQIIREQERQKDVFRNRLARALRTDYQDFLDAAGSEMTIEMGNVMVAKIDGIFRILMENGINPGEHS